MNPVLQEILDSGHTESPSGERLSVHPHAISKNEGMFLRELILELKPKVSLEIGMAYGVSALFICDALAQVNGDRHIIIDSGQYTGYKGTGLYNLKKAGHEKLIEFFAMKSHQALPKLTEEKRRIDFAF